MSCWRLGLFSRAPCDPSPTLTWNRVITSVLFLETLREEVWIPILIAHNIICSVIAVQVYNVRSLQLPSRTASYPSFRSSHTDRHRITTTPVFDRCHIAVHCWPLPGTSHSSATTATSHRCCISTSYFSCLPKGKVFFCDLKYLLFNKMHI
jgi:hypothetical protein